MHHVGKILLTTGLAALLVLAGCSDDHRVPSAPQPTAVASAVPNADAQAVESVADGIIASWASFDDDVDKFLDVSQKVTRRKNLSAADRQKLTELFAAMRASLTRAGDITVPAINDAELKQNVMRAVEANKKWAQAEQSRLAAIAKGDTTHAQKFVEYAEAHVLEAATALGLAYKSAGM
ncbi:MAG: hypothetical protein LBU72_08695 [Burkholderiaceae bacterium]|jgi:hypothetical protein|nr:hypothetical protein [Burkholderiaceae bacterium]